METVVINDNWGSYEVRVNYAGISYNEIAKLNPDTIRTELYNLAVSYFNKEKSKGYEMHFTSSMGWRERVREILRATKELIELMEMGRRLKEKISYYRDSVYRFKEALPFYAKILADNGKTYPFPHDVVSEAEQNVYGKSLWVEYNNHNNNINRKLNIFKDKALIYYKAVEDYRFKTDLANLYPEIFNKPEGLPPDQDPNSQIRNDYVNAKKEYITALNGLINWWKSIPNGPKVHVLLIYSIVRLPKYKSADEIDKEVRDSIEWRSAYSYKLTAEEQWEYNRQKLLKINENGLREANNNIKRFCNRGFLSAYQRQMCDKARRDKSITSYNIRILKNKKYPEDIYKGLRPYP